MGADLDIEGGTLESERAARLTRELGVPVGISRLCSSEMFVRFRVFTHLDTFE